MATEEDLAKACLLLYWSFYLDDLAASFDTIGEAKSFVADAIRVLEIGNFNLVKWSSNNTSILEGLSNELLYPADKQNTIELNTNISLKEYPNQFAHGCSLVDEGGDLLPSKNDGPSGLKCLGISYSPPRIFLPLKKISLLT